MMSKLTGKRRNVLIGLLTVVLFFVFPLLIARLYIWTITVEDFAPPHIGYYDRR